MYWVKLIRTFSIEQNTSTIRVTCRDLPKIDLQYSYSQETTPTESLLAAIRNSIEGALSIIISGGGDIPSPTAPHQDEVFIPLKQRTLVCVALYENIVGLGAIPNTVKTIFKLPSASNIYEILDPCSKENAKLSDQILERFLRIVVDALVDKKTS